VAHRIGVIPGDGIGPSVVDAALKVLRAAGVDFEEQRYDIGADRYARDGHVLSEEEIAGIRACDAVLKGPLGPPIGDTRVPPGTVERGIILRLRFDLDQYINLRPFNGNGLEFVVVRENTEGSYAGEGGVLRRGTPHEVATQGSVNTRMGVERCVRYAFELANSRERKHLTLVHKTNVLTFAGDLWQRVFNEVAAEYPDVKTAYNHVDASMIYMVEDPGRYDVIVTDNLFGDILTDLAGAITGGIGLAASGNVNPDRTAPSMFEPVHGSAPDIAGQGKADPTATVLSVAMLLDHLGHEKAARGVEAAVEADLQSRSARGSAVRSTSEIGDALAARVAG
jgi:3-isopropylmalate dehydrogenase